MCGTMPMVPAVGSDAADFGATPGGTAASCADACPKDRLTVMLAAIAARRPAVTDMRISAMVFSSPLASDARLDGAGIEPEATAVSDDANDGTDAADASLASTVSAA